MHGWYCINCGAEVGLHDRPQHHMDIVLCPKCSVPMPQVSVISGLPRCQKCVQPIEGPYCSPGCPLNGKHGKSR
jgi:hypothetical protein